MFFYKVSYPSQELDEHLTQFSKANIKDRTQLFQIFSENLVAFGLAKQHRENWSIILGGLSSVPPRYKGSNEYRLGGLPFIVI